MFCELYKWAYFICSSPDIMIFILYLINWDWSLILSITSILLALVSICISINLHKKGTKQLKQFKKNR